jgi:MFS family permease
MTFSQRLERAHPALFCAYAGLAAFSAYFAMYAFRKPFSAATFDHVAGWGFLLDYKVALIIAQVLGYALSKIIGVKLISEMGHRRRALAIIGLIALSWLALVLFAVLPVPWNVAALFLNGLPLGLIWGLVFSYVEGRRTSEMIGAILCASFILSSGVVKSVGRWLLDDKGISAFWMPATTGALFFPVLLIAVLGLSLLPPPNAADRAERTERAPMNGAQRAAFFRKHSAALIPLIIAYVLLTAFRDFRDNFAAEIWQALGYKDVATMFTASEIPVALLSLATLGLLMVVRDNMRALLLVHGAVMAGALLIGASTLAHQMGWLGPASWMILTGAGLYMAYTPFNAMLFDRIIAATREVGTAGFLIYLADASGYAGTVGLLLLRNFSAIKLDWLSFFEAIAYCTSILCFGGVLLSALHFARPRPRPLATAPVAA